MIKQIDKTKVYLFLILVLAFFLRIYKCNINTNFSSGDETGFILSAVYFIKLFKFSSIFVWLKDLYKIVSVTWGYGQQLIVFVNILLLRLLRINLNEFTLIIPYIIYGTIGCLLIYLTVKEIYNSQAGIIAALFLAVSPWHILAFRTAGNHAVPIFLLLCAIYFFIITCKNKFEIKWQYISAGVFTGLYIISDGQFPAFCVLLFVIAYLFAENDKIKTAIKNVINKKILTIPVILTLPVIFVQLYFILYGRSSYGYLGHYFAKESKPGFYLADVLRFLKYNFGLSLLIICIIGVIYNYKKLIRLEKASFAYFMLFLYGVPWLFLVNKEATMVINYLYPVQIALIILGSVFLADIFKMIKGYNIIKIGLLLIIAVMTIVYYFNNIFPANQNLHKNYGVKTAGYIIREKYSGDKNINIFTDLEPPLARYYFSDLNIYGIYDLNLNDKAELLNYFNTSEKKINLAALTAPAYDILKDRLKQSGFNNIIFIKNNGKIDFLILEKGLNKQIIISAPLYDKLFNKRYGNIKSLLSEHIWENTY